MHLLRLALVWGILALVLAQQFQFDFGDDLTANSSQHHQSSDDLLWGPYRSSLYFGLRPRIPKSLLAGLMWFNIDSYEGFGQMRHFYEQGDDLEKANWVQFDPRIGGRQIIKDNNCHITISIDFIKSKDGKSWGVKVKAKPYPGFESVKTSFIFYAGLEGEGIHGRTGLLEIDEGSRSVLGYKKEVILRGSSEDLGLFDIIINRGKSTKNNRKVEPFRKDLDISKAHHLSLSVPDDNVWKAKDIFMTLIQESIQDLMENVPNFREIPIDQAFVLRDINKFTGNLHFVQNIYQGSCDFDVVFKNAETPEDDQINFGNIEDKVRNGLQRINRKFSENFQLQSPFNNLKKYSTFARELVSGLLGGLTYMHGDSLVDRTSSSDEESFEEKELVGEIEGPSELFTLVPSRPFFPRGFYWDEGFHLLPLLQHDPSLVLDILKSWFNLIDENGWIAREQILGPEARSRVPEKFQVQDPLILNPPTLMMVFSELLTKVSDTSYMAQSDTVDFNQTQLGDQLLQKEELLLFAKKIYPKLKLHFQLFRTSQKGIIEEFDRGANEEAYRWRGRTLSHCLASGLDDYPRPLPADVAELNVDLLSWIGVMARSMKMLAEFLQVSKDFNEYLKIEKDVISNIELLHWSTENTFCDLTVDENDKNVHSCHKGYISIFPFLTKLIRVDDVSKLELVVDLISDPEEIWSDFGVRSLSKKDMYYKTEENYWRSPIWININYMILESLIFYRQHSTFSVETNEKFKSTYSQLRLNLVNNVKNQWDKTGFVWEQYDDSDGTAKGAKNFLGWSSLVVLIMKMPPSI